MYSRVNAHSESQVTPGVTGLGPTRTFRIGDSIMVPTQESAFRKLLGGSSSTEREDDEKLSHVVKCRDGT